MRLYLYFALSLLASVNVALCGVGDVGVSQGFLTEPLQEYPGGALQAGTTSNIPEADSQMSSLSSMMLGNPVQPQVGSFSNPGSTSYVGTPQMFSSPSTSHLSQGGGLFSPVSGMTSFAGTSQMSSSPYASQGSSQLGGYMAPGTTTTTTPTTLSWPSSSQGTSGTAYPSGAPQIGGPYEEHLSPTELSLAQPQGETFQPEGSLDFTSATPPSGISMESVESVPGAGSWYWPGAVVSRNKLYAQTSAGFKTVAGCSYGGYLPLWADVSSSGNFYTYEWYPGQWTPKVRWWEWTSRGYKKGWFNGDVSGWHILSYHCRDWSNYLYVYVWPASGAQSSQSYQSYGYQTTTVPQGSPTPPDPNAEGLILPDFNLVTSKQGCTGQSCTVYTPKPVYPTAVTYRCNEYYVQVWPNKLTTAAGVKRGEYIQLWSKIGKSGDYWSFEWAPCGGYPRGYYCFPEIKNLGYKGTGWYPTWFSSSHLGWHILAYNSNDWSNYIYIYVWPTS